MAVICEKNLRNQILFLMVEKGVAVMSRTYYSKKKCGVDTADFYHQFGMSVRTVAEETGISRQGESFARQEMLQEMRAEMGFGNMIL